MLCSHSSGGQPTSGSTGNSNDSVQQTSTAPRKSFSSESSRASLSGAYERELVSIGATQALVDHLIVDEAKVALRIFLLDNSGSTAVEDGTLLIRTDDDKHQKSARARGMLYSSNWCMGLDALLHGWSSGIWSSAFSIVLYIQLKNPVSSIWDSGSWTFGHPHSTETKLCARFPCRK